MIKAYLEPKELDQHLISLTHERVDDTDIEVYVLTKADMQKMWDAAMHVGIKEAFDDKKEFFAKTLNDYLAEVEKE